MSVRMAAARAYARATLKPRLVRAPYEKLQRINRPDPPRGVARRHEVEVADLDGARAVWLDRGRIAAGAIVYTHGGSYITGPQREQWEWFSQLCSSAGMAGLLVDYTLTPQAAYPVALDQAMAAGPEAPRLAG